MEVLEVLELEVLEVLELLVLEVLELEVLELLELLVLEVLELVVLEVLELLVLEVLEMKVLEVLELLVLVVLELEVLEVLELLVLEVLELVVLEVLELLVLEVLELLVLQVLELEVLELEVLGSTGTPSRRPFFYPQLQSSLPPPDSALRSVFSLLSSTGLTPPLLCPPPDQSQPPLLPGSKMPTPSPYRVQTGSFAERREPESSLTSSVCTISRARRPRPPHVLGTHTMALRPSSVPQRVALPFPPASSLPDVPDPESDHARAASPTVTRLLATIVTDPSF
ncbi:unnamed protein product [Closterium sp. Yama58-4]|nr:unnamed protein product [Closterium sp. Yama58-4]